MPIPTPFHERTFAHCKSLRYKDWAGYYTVCSYEPHHDPEYFAIRHAAALIDVSPLFKYDITGPDAVRFLSRVTVKDISKLKPGRVTYLCWCDDDGMLVDDGTVTNLGDGTYRVTAAEPSIGWFARFQRGYDIKIEDISEGMGTLAVQGPNSRDLLASCTDGPIADLRFFGHTKASIAGVPVDVTRTGYTGDLGYEVWVGRAGATKVYDAIHEAGRPYSALPCGLDAMDVSRVEAGFIMNGVDYFSAPHCMIEDRKNSPYELGLGFTVQLDRDAFVGQAALKRAKTEGVDREFAVLDIDWPETEAAFAEYGLPPELCTAAWRDGRPVYDLAGEWIGMATSGAWSPTLKKNLALAQVRPPFHRVGAKVKMELTVEYRRHAVTATVIESPAYNPERKRS